MNQVFCRNAHSDTRAEHLVYTRLIGFKSDEFYSVVAEAMEETRKLVEDGFDYVCQKDEIMLFPKRK